MKPATMERRILSLDSAIRAIHGSIMEIQISVLELTARLDAGASSHGLEGDRSPSPPRPSLRDDKDEAGGE